MSDAAKKLIQNLLVSLQMWHSILYSGIWELHSSNTRSFQGHILGSICDYIHLIPIVLMSCNSRSRQDTKMPIMYIGMWFVMQLLPTAYRKILIYKVFPYLIHTFKPSIPDDCPTLLTVLVELFQMTVSPHAPSVPAYLNLKGVEPHEVLRKSSLTRADSSHSFYWGTFR